MTPTDTLREAVARALHDKRKSGRCGWDELATNLHVSDRTARIERYMQEADAELRRQTGNGWRM